MGSLRSMTGYGKAVRQVEGYRVTAEIKSVNHRYLELNVKIPRDFMAIEAELRSFLSERIARGRVDVYIQIETEGIRGKNLKIDKELLLALYNSVKDVSQELGLPLPPVSYFLREVLIVESSHDEEELKSLVFEAVSDALDSLNVFREREGEKLKRDILRRLAKVEEFVEKAESIAHIAVTETREKLMEKLRSIEIDESRIIQEVSIAISKVDVNEELVRLRSHIDEFIRTINEGSPCGKKLDFLTQEMLREANTFGVKIAHAKLSHLAVEMKTEIEKIREQVQNIE